MFPSLRILEVFTLAFLDDEKKMKEESEEERVIIE